MIFLESIKTGETLNFLTLFSGVLLPQPSHGPSFETVSEKRDFHYIAESHEQTNYSKHENYNIKSY
jgi:hypothetical protein